MVGVLVACMVFVAACGGGDDDDDAVGESDAGNSEKPRLVVAIPADPPNMDLMRDISTIIWKNIGPSVAESLASLEFDGDETRVEPLLATGWEQVDELRWRVELRDDVEFSTGDPMTADDVAASINYGIHETSGFWDTFYSTVDSAEVVDEHTVDLVLNAPDPILPKRLPFLKVMPANTLDPDATTPPTTFVGVGQYVLAKWDRGQRIVLEPNENYYGDPAAYSSVEFIVRPEESARVAAVEAGEAHIAWEISPDSADRVDQVLSPGGYEIAGYVLNTVGQKAGGSIMEDKNVRIAINHAIDREAIRDSIYGGRAQLPKCQYNPQQFSGPDPDLVDYEYDPDLARQMITDAGVEGATVEIYSTPYFPRTDELSAAVAEYFNAVGLKANITTVEFDKWIELYSGVGGKGGELPYDMTSITHGNDLFESTVKTFDNIKSLDAGGGRWMIGDPAIDEAIAEAVSADLDTREVEMNEVWQMFCEGAYALPIVAPELLYGATEDVVWEPKPNGDFNLVDVVLK